MNEYLKLVGLKFELNWKDAIDARGNPLADLRLYTLDTDDESIVKIAITDPAGTWGRAGLHTGEQVTKFNGTDLSSRDDFWRQIKKPKMGDTVELVMLKSRGVEQLKVIIGTYKQPVITIRSLDNQAGRQQKLRQQWTGLR